MKIFPWCNQSRKLSLETAFYSERDKKVSLVMKQNEFNKHLKSTVDINPKLSLITENNKYFSNKKRKQSLTNIQNHQQSINCCLATVCFMTILNIFITCIMWTTDWYQMAIYKTLVLDESNINIDMWRNPTWHPLLSVHIYNYTNTESIQQGFSKPHVEELGPYVFRETSKKVNVTFHLNGTVSYRLYRDYTFLPELSTGDINDTVRTPNVFLQSAAYTAEMKNWITAFSFSMKYLVKPDVFNKMIVKDLLMGYEDMYTKFGSELKKFIGEKVPSKYGLLTSRIGLSKDMITMNTGKYNIDLYGIYEKINGNSNMEKWNAEACDKLSGTDGTIHPPTLVARKQPLSVFSDGSCRTSTLYYKKEINKNGLPLRHYVLDPNIFVYKPSKKSCFCNNEVCPPNGTQTISPCVFGSPIFMSYPRFKASDKAVTDGITGLIEFKEQTNYFNIHKDFGVLLDGKTSMQINVQSQNIEGYSGIKYGTYLPISWMELDLTSPPENMLQFFYIATYSVKYIEIFLKYGSIGITLVCLLYFIFHLRKIKHTSI